MNDLPIIHAVMYRDYKIGTLCNSGAWGAPEAFSMITDRVTCPGCRGKLDGGEVTEPEDPGHDRRVIEQALKSNPMEWAALVRCQHVTGLALRVRGDRPNSYFLKMLPCPCNGPREEIGTLTGRFDKRPFSAYFRRRVLVISRAIAESAIRRGLDVSDLTRTYANRVHDRHLSGLSLATPGPRSPLMVAAGRRAALMAAVITEPGAS